MIHASRHIRAFRLMKDITKKQGAHGEFTFYGKNDFAPTGTTSTLRS